MANLHTDSDTLRLLSYSKLKSCSGRFSSTQDVQIPKRRCVTLNRLTPMQLLVVCEALTESHAVIRRHRCRNSGT